MEKIVSDFTENEDLEVLGGTISHIEDREEVIVRRKKRRFPRKNRKKTGYVNYEMPDEFQDNCENENIETNIESDSSETNRLRIDSTISHEAEDVCVENEHGEKEREQETIAHLTEEFSNLMTPMLDRNSKTYDIHNFTNNIAFIFNQENIVGYEPRRGTQKDVDALKDSFGTIGFHVEEPFNDFTRDEIWAKLEDISTSDFTDYGCLVIIFLTHGSSRGVLKARDRNFCESEVLQYFKGTKNESLLSKPKIFIIQACRGTKVSYAAFAGQPTRMVQHDASPDVYSLPAEADFLVIHSTYAGNVSHRHTELGSWFIQTLCKWIKDSPSDMEINVLLTRIKQEVAINREHEIYDGVTQQNEINKQMPIYYTTLIRDLYLKKRVPDGDVETRASEQQVTYLDVSGSTSRYDTAQHSSKVEGSYLYQRLRSASELSVHAVNFRRQHFEYLRERLRDFVQEHNMEEHAQRLINIADAVGPEDIPSVRVIADQTAREIAIFLKKYARDWVDMRSIFFYEE